MGTEAAAHAGSRPWEICLPLPGFLWVGGIFVPCLSAPPHVGIQSSKAAGCSFGERQLPAVPSRGQSSFGYMRGATGWQDPLVVVLPVMPRAGV